MGERRAHHPHVALAGEIHVGGETALSGQQWPVLEPPDRLADDAHQRIFSAAARTALRMFW